MWPPIPWAHYTGGDAEHGVVTQQVGILLLTLHLLHGQLLTRAEEVLWPQREGASNWCVCVGCRWVGLLLMSLDEGNINVNKEGSYLSKYRHLHSPISLRWVSTPGPAVFPFPLAPGLTPLLVSAVVWPDPLSPASILHDVNVTKSAGRSRTRSIATPTTRGYRSTVHLDRGKGHWGSTAELLYQSTLSKRFACDRSYIFGALRCRICHTQNAPPPRTCTPRSVFPSPLTTSKDTSATPWLLP